MAQRGSFGGEAELLLQPEFVHFDDDAVDLIRQFLALLLPFPAVLLYLLDGRAALPLQRVEVQGRNGFEFFRMPRERRSPARQQVIAEKIELPRSGDARIEHAYRSRRRVSRIGEALAAQLFLLFVEFCKSLQRHDDFAAHFNIAVQAEPFGFRGVHPMRNGFDRGHIGCHILAVHPVTSRHRQRELSFFVMEGHAQPIVFVFDDVFNFRTARNIACPAIKSIQFLERECVIQAQHRRIVPARLESLTRRSAHPLRGRIRRNDFRVLRFELLELIHQPVEFGVGDGGPVEHVIAVLVQADFLAQFSGSLEELVVVFGLGHNAAGRRFKPGSNHNYTIRICGLARRAEPAGLCSGFLGSSFLVWGCAHRHPDDPIEHQYKSNGGNRESDAVFHEKPRGLSAIPHSQIALGKKPQRTRDAHGSQEVPERHAQRACSQHKKFERRGRRKQSCDHQGHESISLHPMVNLRRLRTRFFVKCGFLSFAGNEIEQHRAGQRTNGRQRGIIRHSQRVLDAEIDQKQIVEGRQRKQGRIQKR